MTGACGCVRLMQQSGDSGKNVTTQSDSTITVARTPVSPGQPVSQVTSGSGIRVTDAQPELTPDPYPVQHGTRINQTAPGPAFYPPAFTRTYTLRGNAVGLEVDVAEGPLLIYFDIDPMYDCLNDPESCRGTVLVPVNRPYCTITITDNQTHQIVAEDGYAQEYSSQKTNRTIEIFAGGQYRITVTGNSLDITLSVADGSAQQNGTVLTSQPTTSPVSRAEEMQRYGP